MVDVEQLKDGGETTVFPKARENGTEPEEVGGQEGCDLDEQEAHHYRYLCCTRTFSGLECRENT